MYLRLLEGRVLKLYYTLYAEVKCFLNVVQISENPYINEGGTLHFAMVNIAFCNVYWNKTN